MQTFGFSTKGTSGLKSYIHLETVGFSTTGTSVKVLHPYMNSSIFRQRYVCIKGLDAYVAFPPKVSLY